MSENIEYSIDPVIWFSERELKFIPKHFTLAKSPLTLESKKWIINNLRGRYSITGAIATDELLLDTFFSTNVLPAFEDPQEAVMYELMWSS